jgi:Na+-transporting methylmalonyl-CoA/oxaloacetate decarboxylase gamma subunit
MGEELSIALQLTGTGMSVVFSGLVILFVLMMLFQRFEKMGSARKVDSTPETSRAASGAEVLPDAIPPEVVVAISAAVGVAVGRPFRVRRIRYRSATTESLWSKQGRITIMGSHVTKR